MVGAMSVVAGSLMDAKTCPCLDLSLQRSTITKRNAPWSGSLELSCSSFANRSSVKALSGSKKLKKQRKNQGRLVVVNNLGGQYEDNFEDVKRVRSSDFLCILLHLMLGLISNGLMLVIPLFSVFDLVLMNKVSMCSNFLTILHTKLSGRS